MAVEFIALNPNPTIQVPGLCIYTGIVQCLFRGNGVGVTRDTLSFIVTEPRISLVIQPPQIACTMSPASIAYDGAVSDALWAVDSTAVSTVNEDRGTGTAQMQIFASL